MGDIQFFYYNVKLIRCRSSTSRNILELLVAWQASIFTLMMLLRWYITRRLKKYGICNRLGNKPMFNQLLLLVYRLVLSEGRRKRINWIEQCLGFNGGVGISADDRRNEPSAYEAIFSEEHREKLEQLHLKLLNEMNGVPYQQCGDVLEALAFIQEISATALWTYHHSVGAMNEQFVRDFDRLDVSNERIRLYESAQKHWSR